MKKITRKPIVREAAEAEIVRPNLEQHEAGREGRSGLFSAVPQYILVGLLMLSTYFIGTLKTKVDYMQGGEAAKALPTGQAAAQKPASRFKNIDDALRTMAKEVKLDDKKFMACVGGGEKAAAVTADMKEGQSYGVSGTPGFFINGKFLAGAFPFEAFKEIIDKELDGTGSDEAKAYSETLQQAASRGQFDPKPKQIALGTAQRKGSQNARVTIVEYSDFQCPFCKAAKPTLSQILKEYDGKVQIVFKDYPLSFHQHAQKTAEAARCAADQGKFWEFHDILFQTQEEWTGV